MRRKIPSRLGGAKRPLSQGEHIFENQTMCSSKISRLIMMMAIGVAVLLSAAVLFGQKDKKDRKAKNGVETLAEARAGLWLERTAVTTPLALSRPGRTD